MRNPRAQRPDTSSVGMPELSDNVITKGRCYKAGEEIPDEEFSLKLLKYVARDNGYRGKHSATAK